MIHFLKFLFSKAFIINLLIAVVLLGGGLYLTLNYLDDFTLHGQTLEVPNLEGKDFESLVEVLDPNEFMPMLSDSIYLRGVKSGSVVDQDPKPGKMVKQGRKIYLTVAAKQSPKVTMPDLLVSLRQATSLMETYGLEVGELIYRPDICVNCVLEQRVNGKVVEAGTKINGGSAIDLVVGQGLSKELTAVPYLIGNPLEGAKLLLTNVYLNIGGAQFDETIENAEDTLNAVVYKQTPSHTDGEPTVQMGSSVYLYLTTDTNKVPFYVNSSDTL